MDVILLHCGHKHVSDIGHLQGGEDKNINTRVVPKVMSKNFFVK